MHHGRVQRASIGVAGKTVPLPRRVAYAAGMPVIQELLWRPSSQAAQIGLEQGDVILALDGKRVGGIDISCTS